MKNDGNNMSIVKNLLTCSRAEAKLPKNQMILTELLSQANLLSPDDEVKVKRNALIQSFSALARISAVATPIWIIASNPVVSNLVFGAFFPILAIPTMAWTRKKEAEKMEQIIDRYMIKENVEKLKDLVKETDNSVQYAQIIDDYVQSKSASH
jgi:hypothetical protein